MRDIEEIKKLQIIEMNASSESDKENSDTDNK